MLAEWLGSYGIAIIALSFLSFVLLYPFTRKAYQIQQEELYLQKILQEQIKDIKANYYGAEQFDKIQRLYDRYSYHPIMAVRSVFGLLIQLPFLLAVFYMLSNCSEIQGISWGVIPNLGSPDQLLSGINVLPFVMTLISVTYIFVIPSFDSRQRVQTVVISLLFLVLLYSAPSALLVFWNCNILWSLLNSILSVKLNWIGEYIAENDLALHVIFALVLTVGLLVPSEIYIRNASQLWFDYKDILKYLISDVIVYFTFLLIIYVICFHKKIKDFYIFLLMSFLCGVFLQSYLIGLDYGTFDGHQIDWGVYTVDGVINTLIWLACFGISYIGCVKKKNKFYNVIKKLSFSLIHIQCLVLLFTLVKYPIQKDIIVVDGKTGVLTTQNMYTVSKKENIIVFLLDAFDASVFEELLNKKSKILMELDGFTYYPDTISSYGYTHFSLPEILTGKLYDNRYQYIYYLTEAWKNNYFYKVLKDNNFSINLYTDGTYVAANSPIDNLISTKLLFDRSIANQFEKIVRFRIAPHYLKCFYYQYQTDIQNPKILNSNVKQYNIDDRNFYVHLNDGLKFTEKNNVFNFYHLNGLHHPYIFDENVNYLKSNEKGSAYKQAIASLKIVTEYIKQMKQHGVYDNTTFAILADHGTHNTIGSRPLLLLKYKGDKGFSVNNRPTEVSELMALIIQRLSNRGMIVNSNNKRFYYYEDETKQFTKFLVKSPAKNPKMWVPLGKVEKSIDRRYKIGEIIDFGYLGNSFNYKESGWYTREFITGSAIANHEANLVLHIENYDEIKNDLKLNCSFAGILKNSSYQNVRLFLNDYFIGNLKFVNDNSDISFKIPRHIINQKIVRVKFIVDRTEDQVIYDAGVTIWLHLMKIWISEDD